MVDRPTVFVIDDEASVRDALALFLDSEGLSVKTYDTAQSFLDEYRSNFHGCMIVDIRMPDMSGLELQETLNGKGVHLPVIFLTGHGDVPMSAKAFKAGAMDFIEKPFNDEDLLASIRDAIAKDRALRQLRLQGALIVKRFSRLTPREKQVMQGVVAGKPNKVIAKELGVSPRTIDIHRSRVMQKMGARTLPDLVTMAAAADISLTN